MNRRDRPRVIANFARTFDGKVTTRTLTPTGFTSSRDHDRLHAIRERGDAILVGRATAATDTMSLTVRGRAPADQPFRVLVSNSGRLPATLRVFQAAGGERLIFSTEAMPMATRRRLAPLAAVHLHPEPSVDLAAMLHCLRRDYGVRTVVCEGGPTLFRSLLTIGAIDELHLTMAPRVFGGAAAPTLTGTTPEFLQAIVRCSLVSMEVIDDECYLHYRVAR